VLRHYLVIIICAIVPESMIAFSYFYVNFLA